MKTLDQVIGDFELFCGTFLKIRTRDMVVKPLIFNPAQKVIDYYRKQQESKGLPVRLIILKSRQLGVSTYAQAYSFWRVLQPLTVCLTIAHDIDSTQRIFEMSKFFYENLPDYIRPKKRRSNRREIILENPDERTRDVDPGLRSRIEIRTAGHVGSGKGLTVNVLHVSEVAMFRNADLIASNIFPAVPPTPGSAIIMESTAHIMGDWFRDQWELAKTGESDFIPIFLPWVLEPSYCLAGASRDEWIEKRPLDDYEKELLNRGLELGHIAFRRMKIAELKSEELFKQEYPLTDEEAWISVGTPLIPSDVLRKLEAEAQFGLEGEISILEGFSPKKGGRLMVWKPPERGVEYVIGVDTSQGAEHSDPSAIQVISSGEVQEQVARWHGRVDPIAIAPIVYALHKWYNEAMVCIEVNGTGLMTQRAVQELGVFNLYRWRYLDRLGDSVTERVGWVTTSGTKPSLVSSFRHAILSEKLVIRDPKTIAELKTFVQDGHAARAAPGEHDDLVMALAIASMCDTLSRGSGWKEIPQPRAEVRSPVQYDLLPGFEDRMDWRYA